MSKFKTRLIIQRIRAAISAGAKPAIVKPSTIAATPKSSRAFMTNVNNPRVRMLIGKVRMTRIGFTTALAIPKSRATIKAVVNESTLKPGTRLATMIIVRAERIQFARILNMSSVSIT